MPSAQSMSQPDVIRAGEVMATLNDWRAITFVMMFLVVALIAERGLAAWNMARERTRMATNMEAMRKEQADEREKMRQVAKEFSEAADLVAQSMNNVSTELSVVRAFVARAEAVIGMASHER